jgi:uncharacterized protein
MWHLTRSAVKRWIETLLHVHDTPERTSAAFALGIVVGFSPFIGFHTIIGVALAFLFRLNRVAVLAGLWANLPWFAPAYYAGATAFGAWLTGTPFPPNLTGQLEALRHLPGWIPRADGLGRLIRPLLFPFTLGSTLSSLVLAIPAYWSALAFIRARRRHHSATRAN